MNKRVILMAVILLAAMLGMSAQEMRKDSLAFAKERMEAGLSIFDENQDNYLKSRDCFMEALPFADSAMTVKLCGYIGYCWFAQGMDDLEVSKYSEAEQAAEASLEWYRRSGVRKDEIGALDLLSLVRKMKGDIDGALECLDMVEKRLEPTLDRKRVQMIKDRYAIYNSYGITDRINPLFDQVDSLMHATSDDYVRLECTTILADNAAKSGFASKAISLYRNALDELAVYSGEGDLRWVKTDILHKLTNQYLIRGKYEDALDCALQRVAIARTDTKESSDLGQYFIDVAQVFVVSGDTSNFKVYADSVLNNGGRPVLDPWKHVVHLESVGAMYRQIGRKEMSLRCYNAADSVAKMNPDRGSAHQRAQLKVLIAGGLYQAGRIEESKQAYSEYFEICRNVYGEIADDTIMALDYLANILAYAGDIEQGSRCLMDAMDRISQKIEERVRFLPTATRRSYLELFLQDTFLMTAFGLKAGHECDEFSARSWEALLLTKSLLLASERNVYETIRRYGTDEDKVLYGQLMNLQRKLSAAESRQGTDSEASKDLLRQLLAIDTKLAEQCYAYGNISGFLAVDSRDIQAVLADDDVVVDMADFMSEGTPTYCAYIVRKGSRYPELVRLYEKVENKTDNKLSEDDVKAFLANLTTKLHPGENVFFVPSGKFHTIPIEAVKMPDGSLFGEEYNVVRLSSARDVLKFKEGESLGRKRLTASLFGNLTYGVESEYSSLAATATELRDITKALKRKAVVNEYSGPDGTVEAFLALDGNSTDIIHIATHGFYYEPKGNESKSSAYITAMNMSGLVMAGGEKLTATDIAAMDLSGTSLVCLSACETGLGHVTPEGIYGLQRAFKKSGVSYIVVNVGEVSDVASSLFMTEFYKALISNCNDIHTAFKTARTAVQKRYPDPYYWSGFLLLD